MVFFHSGSASVFGSRAGAPAAPGRDPFRAAAVGMLERGLETRLLLAGSGVMRCSGHVLFRFCESNCSIFGVPIPWNHRRVSNVHRTRAHCRLWRLSTPQAELGPYGRIRSIRLRRCRWPRWPPVSVAEVVFFSPNGPQLGRLVRPDEARSAPAVGVVVWYPLVALHSAISCAALTQMRDLCVITNDTTGS
jgi:hypothetical protein